MPTLSVADCIRESIHSACAQGSTEETVHHLKRSLSEAIHAGHLQLDDVYLRPKASSYARRLLYRDPALGVTAVVMTWGAGQSTPVHDHAGIWCVEGVVLGRMDVIQYELQEEEAERVRFTRRDCVHATVGQAGCLIPPFEHHVLANVSGQTSITLHIYGGEMSTCNIYLPLEGDWYQRQSRGLHYDE